MKKIFLSCCLILTAFSFALAQNLDSKFYADVEVEFGPVKKNKLGHFDELLEHDNEGGYFTLEMLKRPTLFNLQGKFVLRHYNSKYQLIHEYPIEQEGKKNITYFDLHRYKDDFFLFSTRYSVQEKISEVYLQRFGPDKKLQGSAQIINSSTTKTNDRGNQVQISSNSNSRWNSPLSNAGYTLVKSRLGSKVMLFKNYTYDYIGSNDKTEHYELNMLDAADDMQVVWKTNVDMPYKSQFFEILDGCTDEDGNFYMVGALFTDKYRNVTRDGFPSYTFKIFKYNASGKVFEADIKLKDKFLTDLRLDIAGGGKLVCTGFYSNDKKTTSVNGVYFLSINAQDGTVSKESTKKFELDMVTENMSDKVAKKTKKRAAKGKDLSLYEFRFDELIPRSDGGAIIIAEQYFVRTYTTTSSNSATGRMTTTTHYLYYYNDILVINVTPEGEIEWAHKIHKRQRTTDDIGYWSSYARINTGKELRFIFNDNAKNTPDKPTKEYKSFLGPTKKAMVAVAGIDQNGDINRKLLFKSKNADTILRPKQYLQISAKSILIQSIRKKKYQYVKLTFD